MFGVIWDMKKNHYFYLKNWKDKDTIYGIIQGLSYLSKLFKCVDFFHFLFWFYLFSHELLEVTSYNQSFYLFFKGVIFIGLHKNFPFNNN